MALVINGVSSSNQASDNTSTGQWASGYITPSGAGIDVTVMYGQTGVLQDSVTQFVEDGQSLNFTAPARGVILSVAFASHVLGSSALVYGYFGEAGAVGIIATQSGQAGPATPNVTNITRVTVLPAAPSDTQLVAFQPDPAGSPGVEWLLVYNSTEGAWDYVGGAPLTADVSTAESTGSTGYTGLATAQVIGPAGGLPGGFYRVKVGAEAWTDQTPGSVSIAVFQQGGGSPLMEEPGVASPSAGYPVTLATEGKVPLSANGQFVAVYAVGSGTGTWQWRWFAATPIAVTP